LSLEVHLMKRMTKSSQYRHYMRRVLALTRQKFPGAKTLDVELYFRDTMDTLARFFCGEQLSYVEYSDEFMSETKIQKPDDWGLTLG
jgi:hypothetical protein